MPRCVLKIEIHSDGLPALRQQDDLGDERSVLDRVQKDSALGKRSQALVPRNRWIALATPVESSFPRGME